MARRPQAKGDNVTFQILAMLQQPTGGIPIALIIQLVAIALIFWFLLIRPQRKMQQRHREMIAALSAGDEVMTEGGILGKIVHVAEDRLTIKTGENTRVVVARAKIARVLNGPDESGTR
jgi:preprotein translocase subunit YajC